MIQFDAVAVTSITELGAIARVVIAEAICHGARPVRVDGQAIEEAERGVRTVDLVRTDTLLADRTPGHQRSDTAAAKNVTLHPRYRKVRGERPGRLVSTGLNVQETHAVGADAPRQPPSSLDGNDTALVEADPPAVEQRGRVTRTESTGASERECALVLDEEVTLLRKEQAESGQVDLLLVGLHLRKIGVVGEIGRQVLGDLVLHIHTRIEAEVVPDLRARGQVARDVREDEGFDLDVPGVLGDFEAHEGGRQGKLEETLNAQRVRETRDVGQLVLPSVEPRHVESPDLVAPGAVAKRLERDGHLQRPAAVESAYLDLPDGIEVGVVGSLVRHLPFGPAAERCHQERGTIPAIVEGVERDGQVLVLGQDVAVVAHLVGHHALGMILPATSGDVEVGLIKENPHFGLLARRRPCVRLHLDEIRDGSNSPVDRFIEDAVDPEWHTHRNSADGGTSGRISSDDGGRDRGRRAARGQRDR